MNKGEKRDIRMKIVFKFGQKNYWLRGGRIKDMVIPLYAIAKLLKIKFEIVTLVI
jgi:hypothetical protein